MSVWWRDAYARKVRLSRWRGEVLYRWLMLRARLGFPKKDASA
jgi:hypothetical protein